MNEKKKQQKTRTAETAGSLVFQASKWDEDGRLLDGAGGETQEEDRKRVSGSRAECLLTVTWNGPIWMTLLSGPVSSVFCHAKWLSADVA